MQTIFIAGACFHAYHGALPQERTVGGDYQVWLRANYDMNAAIASDNVEDAVNYAEVYKVIEEQMAIPANLLETLADRIMKTIARRFPQITYIWIRVMKCNPPMGGKTEGAGVDMDYTVKK